MAQASQPEPAGRTLRRLIAERGSSTRKLAAATREIDGRGMGASSIGNIARGDDLPSAQALSLLAQALDVPPETFVEYRLARARRLLNERDVGLDAAAENYDQLAAVFPDLLTVNARLLETLEGELAADVAAARVERQRLDALQAREAESTDREDSPPPTAKPARAPRRRARPPR